VKRGAAMSNRVGIKPTPLAEKIEELRALAEEVKAQWTWTDANFQQSKGPSAETMRLYDYDFNNNLTILLWRLIGATIDDLEDAKKTLSGL
jgi:hypothetical protein